MITTYIKQRKLRGKKKNAKTRQEMERGYGVKTVSLRVVLYNNRLLLFILITFASLHHLVYSVNPFF